MTPAERLVLRNAAYIMERYRTAHDAEGLVVSFGAHSPSNDCSVESVSVGVMWNGQVWTGNAVAFEDAVLIARSKIADEKARLAAKASKRAVAKPKTAINRAHSKVTA